MKFIGVRDFRTHSARIWNDLTSEKEMVITSNGKPIAILSSVSEDNLEETLKTVRKSRAIQAVAELQKASVEKGLDKLAFKEIEAEIRAVREEQ